MHAWNVALTRSNTSESSRLLKVDVLGNLPHERTLRLDRLSERSDALSPASVDESSNAVSDHNVLDVLADLRDESSKVTSCDDNVTSSAKGSECKAR